MFYALAIVCDVYFVPSLEKVTEVGTTEKYNLLTVQFLSLQTRS